MHDAGHGDVRMFELKLADGLSEAPLEVPSVLAIAALRNLLDNALRHTAAGTRVELAVETAQGCARFHVRDHGPGIAETDLPHLTRRFWRHGKSGGSGLGLAIVQAIVQRCQCRLDFDSRADGLRVTLEMPLRGDARAHPPTGPVGRIAARGYPPDRGRHRRITPLALFALPRADLLPPDRVSVLRTPGHEVRFPVPAARR